MFGFKKNKKDKKKYMESYIVKDVDNIISIAQSHDIPWKELAKINDIEPPYILIAGETINVPSKSNNFDNENKMQMSDTKTSKSIEQQSDVKNTQIQQSNKIIANNIKINKSVTQKQIVSQEKETMSNVKKKSRKITYASPKNMLHKPSAEPATQSIDIEWLQDDDEAYSEEIQLQKKKLNIRFIVISTIIVLIVGIGVWQSAIWFSRQNDDKNVSVQTLIEENKDIKIDKNEKAVSDNENKNEDMAMEGGEDVSETKNDQNNSEQKEEDKQKEQQIENDVSVEEITVQVLNAGAQVGAAGDITKVFSKEGFKTISAQNAKNDYKGVVIYYGSDKKDKLDIVAKKVPEKYGIQKHEESDEVTKKYKADFVIVLGS